MRGRVIPAVSAVIRKDIRDIYSGNYLPPIADVLKEIGLEDVPMPLIKAGFFKRGPNRLARN